MISDWQYRSLSIIIAESSYRTKEPEPAKSEFSKVFEKIFQQLWLEGVSKESIAKDLRIYVEEIEKLVFGLLSKNKTVLDHADIKLVKGEVLTSAFLSR